MFGPQSRDMCKFSKADLAKDPAVVDDFQHRQRMNITAVCAEEFAVGSHKPLVQRVEAISCKLFSHVFTCTLLSFCWPWLGHLWLSQLPFWQREKASVSQVLGPGTWQRTLLLCARSNGYPEGKRASWLSDGSCEHFSCGRPRGQHGEI